MLSVAISKARCASAPSRMRRSMSSRRWSSSSSSVSEGLMPEARMSRRQLAIWDSRLGIFFSPELHEHFVDLQPLCALFLERTPAFLLDGIVFSLPPILHGLPARLDPAVLLHAMQHGVEHAVGPLHLIFRPRLHLLDDGISIALALGEQRQDKRFSRGGDEFLGKHGTIIHRSA